MKPYLSRFRTGALALALSLPGFVPAPALAETPAGVDELRRDVQRLKAQVDGLRGALEEIAQADRARAAAIARALGAVKETPSQAPGLPDEGASAPAPAAPVAAASVPTRARRAAAAPAPAPVGVVRGKVDVPAGEEVAYVYVENVPGQATTGQKVKIEQVRKTFVPSWAVVQRGTAIEFPNLDGIYHNVFSLSSGNTFDLGLYNSGSEAKAHKFMQPGAVDVYCNIHPQMAASVLVVPNRLFARVGSNGTFEIRDVPAGKRKIVAWSPRSRLSSDWVELATGGEAKVAFKLEPKAKGHRNKLGRPYGSYE